MEQATIERFRTARSDPGRAVLEGFHPLKHALRFGAELLEVLSPDPGAVLELARELAPDVEDEIGELLEPVPRGLYRELAPVPPDTGVVSLARRQAVSVGEILEDPSPAPAVLLEDPSHLGNLGAAVRVAAAAGASGVLATGPHDPWHASALRGSAGLHFAVPVAALEGPEESPEAEPTGGAASAVSGSSRPAVAIDPEGAPLVPGALPDRALLIFGSERRGLAAETLARADLRVRIPMRPGVSSLNLATSVAVVLYAWRLGSDRS